MHKSCYQPGREDKQGLENQMGLLWGRDGSCNTISANTLKHAHIKKRGECTAYEIHPFNLPLVMWLTSTG